MGMMQPPDNMVAIGSHWTRQDLDTQMGERVSDKEWANFKYWLEGKAIAQFEDEMVIP